MNKSVDKKLKQLFQQKFENFEADPSVQSWEMINNKLPQPGYSLKSRGRIVVASVLIIISMISGVIILAPKRPPTSSSEKYKIDYSLFDIEGKTVVKDTGELTTELNRVSKNSYAKAKSLYDTSAYLQTVISKINTSSIDIAMNDDILIDIQPDSSKQRVKINSGNEITENFLFGTTEVELIKNDLQLDVDTIEREFTERFSKSDSIKISEEFKKNNNHFLLKITPFYAAGVYSPILEDNIKVSSFSQSSSLLKNRLGLAFDIGYQSKMNRFDLEFTIGYRFFSKEMSYVINKVTEERETEQLTQKISGINHILKTGIVVRSLSFNPMVFFISHESVFGSLRNQMGKQMINVGMGAEKQLGNRLVFRPVVSYGFSLTGDTKYFRYQPIGWNLEVVRRFRNK